MWRHLFTELYGTFMFGFFVACSDGDATVVMIGLWTTILSTGMISGAHFNPVITLAVGMRSAFTSNTLNKKIIVKFCWYVLMQFLGYFLAGFAGWLIVGETFPFKTGDVSVMTAYAGEIIFTFELVLLALIIADFQDSVLLGTLAVSGMLYIGIQSMLDITSGCFNPALCISLNIVEAIVNDEPDAMNETHLYLFAPFIGAVLAVFFTNYLRIAPGGSDQVLPSMNKQQIRSDNSGFVH